MTGKALAEALDRCEALLAAEKAGPLSEALLAEKEAAVTGLEGLLGSLQDLNDAEVEALAPRLTAVLAANRFSLKWNGLRAQLAKIGQPKAPAPAPSRNRVDITH